jgi:ligand-binding sensor domain-containing protein
MYRQFMIYKKLKWLLIFLLIGFTGCVKDDVALNKNTPYDKIIQVIKVHNNAVWVGTFSSGLYKLENNSWSNYNTSDGLISDEITAIVFDQKDILWVGTKMGISRLENTTWTNITTDDGLYSNDIRSLACDSENNIWIGTNRNRLTKYDGENLTVYHVNPEMSGDPGMGHIHTITCDLDGNIWAGSCISGLSKFDGLVWSDDVNELRAFVTSSVCAKNGEVWIGHFMGAFRFSNEAWTGYTENEGLTNSTILGMDIDSHENIWFGTENGISEFDGTSFFNYTIDDSLFNDYVSSLACDNDGSIWIGNNHGLMQFMPNQ